MVDTTLLWPAAVLRPAGIFPNPVPFSRSGGHSLAGIERVIKTDRGFWSIQYKGIALGVPGRARAWNVIRTQLGGRAGTIAVPVWSYDSAPWLAGTTMGSFVSPHGDGCYFSDGSGYLTPGNVVELATAAALGDTSVTLRRVYGLTDLAGIRFSYQHALYETGVPTLVAGDQWTVPVFPDIRAAIPADAVLEVDLPTCLVHLAKDNGMDGALTAGRSDRADVAFVEAVDHWNDQATA